jgi:tripartite-type tricarboxylate transporter receptor subunit TctC
MGLWRPAVRIVVAALFCCHPALAQPVDDFYKGKTINLILGFSTGGLNDIAGRLVAQHLGRFIPENPRVVAQNMMGAGGLVAANHLANVAARDGTVIASLDRNTAQTAIRGAANVKFDPLQLTWLGSLSNYSNDAYPLWVAGNYPAKTVADINRLATPTRLGAVGGGSNMLMSLLLKEALTLNLQVIRGYTGGPAILLAVERGEVDGLTIGLSAINAEYPQKWRDKEVRPLVPLGRATRFEELPDVPTARELAPTPEARTLIEFAEMPFLVSQPLVAPPGLPVARAAMLQTAFARMMRDPAFVEDAKRRRVELSPIDGQAALGVIAQAAATPKSVIAKFNTIIDP